MVLGVVLGVMMLLLIIFMVMCGWKQRQQRRMMGTYRNCAGYCTAGMYSGRIAWVQRGRAGRCVKSVRHCRGGSVANSDGWHGVC